MRGVSRVSFTTSGPMSLRGVQLAAVHFSGGCESQSVRCAPAPGPGSCASSWLRPWRLLSPAFRSAVSPILGRLVFGRVGAARGLGANCGNTHRLAMFSPYNKSANTEPQLQEAASPQGLWSGCLQR
jgi:hypothetical protein